MYKIFLILTGEDENKRPRSKKLLKLVQSINLNLDYYKIVVSGLSGFNKDEEISSSSKLAKYLIKKNIPKDNIILEEKSMDTLGNMIFSYEIIEQLIREKPKEQIEIILITEGFHMYRSKKLFLKIFNRIKNLNKNISFEFESANTSNISSFYWKNKLKLIVKKFEKNLEITNDVKEYSNDIFELNKKYLRDFVILDLIIYDLNKFRLNSFEQYKDFLFSLPVYNQKYKTKNRYLIQYSAYAHLIQKFLEIRK